MRKSSEKIITELTNHMKILGYDFETYDEVKWMLTEFKEYLTIHHQKQTFKGVTKQMVSQYIEHLKNRENKVQKGKKLSEVYINGYMIALKKLSEFLWKMYSITLPVSHLRRLKVEQQEPVYLTVEEVRKLYEVTEPKSRQGMRDRAMLSVYYGCGLRRTEGELLTLKDIDFKKQMIYVRKGKGNKERYVPISKSVSKYLREYVEVGRRMYTKSTHRTSFLFLSERGKKLQGQSLLNDLKKLKKKAGIDKVIGLHSLRHSIATHLLHNGMELELISSFLGHSSVESTQVYTHIDENEV